MTGPRLGALAAAMALAASAVAAAPVRIAVVKSRALPAYDMAEQGFMSVVSSQAQASATHYVLSGDPTVAARVAAQIKASGPQVVLALGTEAARQVGQAMGGIPVVFAMVVDPVQSGLVSNPARPGGNMTGVSLAIPAGETVQTLRRALPQVKRIGVIYDPAQSQRAVKELSDAARAQGLAVAARAVRSAADVPTAAEELKGKIDALYAPVDATVYSPQSAKFVLLFALRNGIPVVGFSANLVEAGALLGLYPDYVDVGRQAGYLALRILSGEAPGSIAVAAPRKSVLAINLRVERTLGLLLPQSVKTSADRVFK